MDKKLIKLRVEISKLLAMAEATDVSEMALEPKRNFTRAMRLLDSVETELHYMEVGNDLG
jgi:hypothetical protein